MKITKSWVDNEKKSNFYKEKGFNNKHQGRSLEA